MAIKSWLVQLPHIIKLIGHLEKWKSSSKKMKSELYQTAYTKFNSQGTKGLNLRSKLKFLEENTEKSIMALNLTMSS